MAARAWLASARSPWTPAAWRLGHLSQNGSMMIELWQTGTRGRGNADPPNDLVQSVRRAAHLMEIIGSRPGQTVKQMARKLGLNTATAYHLIRTLVFEGYLIRDHQGYYTMGPAVCDRYRDLSRTLCGPDHIMHTLRQAVRESGYSHYLTELIGGRVTITAMADGPCSPWLRELIPGFDGAAHATAMGKALLDLLPAHQCRRYLQQAGMPAYTHETITDPAAFEADLALGRKRGMQTEAGQYQPDAASCAVPVTTDGEPGVLTVVGCALPVRDLMHSAKQVHTQLHHTAIQLALPTTADVQTGAER